MVFMPSVVLCPRCPPCIREPGCFLACGGFFFRGLSLFASAAWMMCFFLQRSVAAVKQAAPARRELLLVIISPEAMGDGPGATGRLAVSSTHLERKTWKKDAWGFGVSAEHMRRGPAGGGVLRKL